MHRPWQGLSAFHFSNMRFFILANKISYSLWNEIVALQKTNWCSFSFFFHGMSLRYGKHKSNWILKQPKNLHQIQIQLKHVQSVRICAVSKSMRVLSGCNAKCWGWIETNPCCSPGSYFNVINHECPDSTNNEQNRSVIKRGFLHQRPNVMCTTYHPFIFRLR